MRVQSHACCTVRTLVGSAPAIGDIVVPLARPQETEDGTPVHTHNRATQVVIPREHVPPQTIREGQHPLWNGDVGQHMINEVRRSFGHAATAAIGTETAPFA